MKSENSGPLTAPRRAPSVPRKTRLQLLDEREAADGRTPRSVTAPKREVSTQKPSMSNAPSKGNPATLNDARSMEGQGYVRGESSTLDVWRISSKEQLGFVPIAVSVETAAIALGLGRTRTWDLVRAGRLPAKRVGNRVLVSVADLGAFIESQPNYLEG